MVIKDPQNQITSFCIHTYAATEAHADKGDVIAPLSSAEEDFFCRVAPTLPPSLRNSDADLQVFKAY